MSDWGGSGRAPWPEGFPIDEFEEKLKALTDTVTAKHGEQVAEKTEWAIRFCCEFALWQDGTWKALQFNFTREEILKVDEFKARVNELNNILGKLPSRMKPELIWRRNMRAKLTERGGAASFDQVVAELQLMEAAAESILKTGAQSSGRPKSDGGHLVEHLTEALEAYLDFDDLKEVALAARDFVTPDYTTQALNGALKRALKSAGDRAKK